LINDIVLDVMQ